jgi:hypothetical protein
MFNVIDRVQRSLQSALDTAIGWNLQRLEGFPYSAYTENVGNYTERLQWYKGDKLKSKSDKEGQEKYPVKINPLPGTVQKHTWAFFGQVNARRPAMVNPRFIPRRNQDDDGLIATAEQVLEDFWRENGGRAYQTENALLSEIFGGCVYKASRAPDDGWRNVKIRLDRVMPHEFVGIFDSSDPWHLIEAWFVREINEFEAAKWINTNKDQKYWWIEHWRRNDYRVQINNEVVWTIDPELQDRYEFAARNPFRYPPLVYVPHLRAGDILGENTFDNLLGLIKELNLMAGHIGDATALQSKDILAMVNVQGRPKFVEVEPGVRILDLSSKITFDESGRPDLKNVSRASITDGMINHYKMLYEQYRRDAFHPAVLDGEDEGSQRSGETLLTRLMGLVSHIDLCRVFLGTGLNAFNQLILIGLADKKENGITEEHLKLSMWQEFAASLPQSRKQLMDEVAIRSSGNLGTLKHLLSLLGDVEDPEGMSELVFAEMAKKAALKRISQNGVVRDGEQDTTGQRNGGSPTEV